uniref:HotDog ACOT-type domain-containing protein n=1 Tax=Phaeomonas parva TaxID=124430 RepID=A0A7S1U6Y5_9STRA
MPALAPPRRVLLNRTSLSNTFMTQPQQRNTAGRIFGGFLMRRAFELAFTTAYLFGGRLPRFEEVDEVAFHLPVEVGELVQFESAVLYVSTPEDGGDDAAPGAGGGAANPNPDPDDPDAASLGLLRCGSDTSDGRPRAHVEVRARVMKPEDCSSVVSNTFNFTFSYNEAIAGSIRLPLPANLEEARRVVQRRRMDSLQEAAAH